MGIERENQGERETPLDPVVGTVGSICGELSKSQGGFTLQTAMKELDDGAKALTIEVGSRYEEHLPLSEYRMHTVGDAESLIAFAKKYGTPERSIIFISEGGLKLVIDDSVDRGRREIVSLSFEKTPEYNAWNGLLAAAKVSHAKLLGDLLQFKTTLATPEILLSMRSAPVNCEVNTTSDIQREGKTIGVIFKTQAGNELKKFPEEFRIKVPIFQDDYLDPSAWADCSVSLVINLPDGPTDKLSFTLRSGDWHRAMQLRLNREIESVRSELPEWTILRGTPAYKDRLVIGAPMHAEYPQR